MLIHPTPSSAARPRGRRHAARLLTAAALRAASRLLDSLAMALAREPTGLRPDAVREFYAEAGAPEGALYVDGELIGHVIGVRRL